MLRTIQKVEMKVDECTEIVEFSPPKDIVVDYNITRVDGGGAEISFKELSEGRMKDTMNIVATVQVWVESKLRGGRYITVSRPIRQVTIKSNELTQIQEDAQRLEDAKNAVYEASSKLENTMKTIVEMSR